MLAQIPEPVAARGSDWLFAQSAAFVVLFLFCAYLIWQLVRAEKQLAVEREYSRTRDKETLEMLNKLSAILGDVQKTGLAHSDKIEGASEQLASIRELLLMHFAKLPEELRKWLDDSNFRNPIKPPKR